MQGIQTQATRPVTRTENVMGRARICKVHVLDVHDPHLNYFTIFFYKILVYCVAKSVFYLECCIECYSVAFVVANQQFSLGSEPSDGYHA
jgi:hypothetical protein